MKHISKINLIVLMIGAFLMAGCHSQVFYTDEQRVDEDGWNLGEALEFEVDVPDTTTYYNFLIDLRSTNSYEYSNLFLFINTTFPDGSIAHDTLGCILADPRTGEWYGKQSGHYISERIPFHQNVRFAMPGRYHFEVRHGMREDNLKGMKNVGLRIEYANPR
ncbi:MAG: gliding motility lipoprotein GldH [Bacteroidales bacterium]|nr:gliding motility lipoprotein GldH [Bacteroidales bacterium]